MNRDLQIVLDRYIARRRGQVRQAFRLERIRATNLHPVVPKQLAQRSGSRPGEGDAPPTLTGVAPAA